MNSNTLKCQKCKYTWITHSEMQLVSCPCCGSKVKNIQIEDKVLKDTPDSLTTLHNVPPIEDVRNLIGKTPQIHREVKEGCNDTIKKEVI